MKNGVPFISFVVLFPGILFAQKIKPSIQLAQDQVIPVVLMLKTTIAQEAMGQAIDFNADGEANHQFSVMRKGNDSIWFRHTVNRISFHFDGMGQKRAFDSDVDKDTTSEFGKPVKELLGRTYDMLIDTTSKLLAIDAGDQSQVKLSTQMTILSNMLKDVFEVALPPQKGQRSFFSVLPDREIGVGDTWSDSLEQSGGKSVNHYTLSAITDSTLIIDLTGNSTTVTKAEMMGNETTTRLNNKSTGKIILDRNTGILRQKNLTIESNGSTEALGGTVPVTSKTVITTLVRS